MSRKRVLPQSEPWLFSSACSLYFYTYILPTIAFTYTTYFHTYIIPIFLSLFCKSYDSMSPAKWDVPQWVISSPPTRILTQEKKPPLPLERKDWNSIRYELLSRLLFTKLSEQLTVPLLVSGCLVVMVAKEVSEVPSWCSIYRIWWAMRSHTAGSSEHSIPYGSSNWNKEGSTGQMKKWS